MDKSQVEIFEGIWADCRRALYVEREGLLAVADLHLGYAWAHRYNGQLMPVDGVNPGARLLEELIAEYKASKLVIAGDIIHQAAPVPQARDELAGLLQLAGKAELILLAGNHDRHLQKALAQAGPGFQAREAFQAGSLIFFHGDRSPAEIPAGGMFVMGHEHPAITLGDGVSTSAKFPCFILGEDGIILPAFSPWAAGSCCKRHEFMSPVARQARLHTALAIMGRKLLPVPLGRNSA